jgi:hypothetical protein
LISALRLTPNARDALRHNRIALGQLAFSFKASRAMTVHVTLAVRVRSGRLSRWRALPASLTFAAVRGLNRRRLHGWGRLEPGVYRLSFEVANGHNSLYSRAMRFSL